LRIRTRYSVKGVKASANLYSLIECAKINGLEPNAYLRHDLTVLNEAGTVEAIEALLPGDMKEDQIKARQARVSIMFRLRNTRYLPC
jgi:hypothetical protein